MKDHFLKIIIVCICLAGCVGLYLYWNSDNRVITRNIKKMSQIANKTGEESGIALLASGSQLSDYFAEAGQFHLGRYGDLSFQRKDLVGQIVAVRKSTPVMLVSFEILEIDVEKPRARVDGILQMEDYEGEPQFVNRQPVQLGMVKEGRKWFVKTVDFLQEDAE